MLYLCSELQLPPNFSEWHDGREGLRLDVLLFGHIQLGQHGSVDMVDQWTRLELFHTQSTVPFCDSSSALHYKAYWNMHSTRRKETKGSAKSERTEIMMNDEPRGLE